MPESDTYLITEKTTDDTIVRLVDSWVKESTPFHEELLVKQRQAIEYYKGNQTDKESIKPFSSDLVYNRVFEATETVVPIVTGTAHTFVALPAENSEVSLKKAHLVGKVLQQKFEDLEIQGKTEGVVRDVILKRFGVMKWFWNTDTDDIDVKSIDPRFILIPKLRLDPHDLPYKIEIQEYTKSEIKDAFPSLKDEDLKAGRTVNPTDLNVSAPNEKIYQVLEVWTKEYVCWKHGGKIIDRKVNPYFDFEGEQDEDTKELRFFNFLDSARDPYVFFTAFQVGESPVGDISLFEAAKPLQDAINTQKRKIIDNLVKLGNGQWVIDSDVMDKEQLDQITNAPGIQIVGKGAASENKVKREPGVPLPAGHFSNLADSLIAFDNVFGTHASIRGQSNERTLGGQMLNREQNLGRIELLTRVVNRGYARLADGLVQLMRLFYDVEHVVKILGKDGAVELVRIIRTDIDPGMAINVKSGRRPTIDPTQRETQAIQLWQLQAIDPETLYQLLDFPNPRESAQKLAAWRQGQLLLEAQVRASEQAALAQAGLGGGMMGKETTAPGKPSAETEKGRALETPNNSMERAKAATAGTAAPLPNPPKM